MGFEDSLAVGRLGESIIAMWLRRQGWNVLPAYEKEIDNGKGPRLFMACGASNDGATDQLITPDLLCVRNGEFRWLEAKHKTHFTWYRIGGYWTTGIDKRHFEHYCEVRQRIGIPVYLFFLHSDNKPSVDDVSHGCPATCPVGLFGAEIESLQGSANQSHESKRWGASGMVYWRPDVHLRKYASLENVWPERARILNGDFARQVITYCNATVNGGNTRP